ncbi:peptidase A24A prepilin type IV [Planctopirus limnophila DSM 3776]|jgi:prepilin peptidase CpaA|uniref:Peptidase A24A prepilin type IV n=3 Tax=Planctopirus TaxID=1649480 RepID=D5SRV7_PLAL2|nr:MULTISPECIES: A24 family peptidase [Planctopirus]ADG66641.1 peptidase A24A prepilin type IV [Planctopirus limnophila DSM 3776]ODA28380.1 peptidase A24 [Planctopirus hydrillae]QDV29707.1 Type 4 prepilin-like proteins leader peptide-processing enzyme [Planctopirus ephydatiae]
MDWQSFLMQHWDVKFVSLVLILAAWIDGKELRVPNWITFPMVLSGLIYGFVMGGWAGLGDSLIGMVVGLACLLPLYAVGGMGAGDVKLMAGMGAWLGAAITWQAFMVSVVVGAIMAIIMACYRKDLHKHVGQAMLIWTEWTTIRDPRKLSEIAAERKPRMLLLPYGIPICIGSIAYFVYAGLI